MRDKVFSKQVFIRSVTENVKSTYRKTLAEASQQEIYQAVAQAVKEVVMDQWMATQNVIEREDPKTVYYMSMEFLPGRLLGNNLINLGAYTQVQEALEELGLDINVIEDQEPDPALGNGGLGRLAACFMDSLATLGYAAYGCGIRYRYGMFKQQIIDGFQVEVPDAWLKDGYPFEMRRPEYNYTIKFGGHVEQSVDENEELVFKHVNYQAVQAVAYDMPIVGYGNNVVDTLIIWDARPEEEFRLDYFDQGAYEKAVEQENLARNLVEVLYPNDNHVMGKELRLKQQYFFVSASIQRALERFKRYHTDLHELPDKVVFQMNDTHPTVAVAELMRILVDEEDLSWDEAWEITTHCVAYTNHTIMAEALEKWPIDIFRRLLPRVYQIVEEINRRFVEQIRELYPNNEEKVRKMEILHKGQVRMAHLAICAGFSVNGVARLHTEILKKQELRDFYEMFPQKFNNKTNGITQRRFLAHGNPLLAEFVTKYAGSGWETDLSKIERLRTVARDPNVQKEFMDIKYRNKVRLAKYIKAHNGIDVDPNSIFDVQVKRLHEYKRQLMNILHVMYLYNKLKANPDMEFYARTFIFGAKAAAGYRNAKNTIKLINTVAEIVNNDPAIGGKIKVVFIEDYRVSIAEQIFAAADVSEQISTASKEASGTGNMKFMLNGAITVGTMDGANVEMYEEVGADNIFIFGMGADEVIEHEKRRDYNPVEIYNHDAELRQVLNSMVDGTYAKNDREIFRELYNSLLNPPKNEVADRYFILADFRAYATTQQKVSSYYQNKEAWARSAILNVAHAGKFSSDRTIQEYVDDIWKLDKISVNMSGI